MPLFSSVVAHFLSPFFIHPNFDLPKKTGHLAGGQPWSLHVQSEDA
jgi:hypothetical protein